MEKLTEETFNAAVKQVLIDKLKEFVTNNDCSSQVWRLATKTILEGTNDTLVDDLLKSLQCAAFDSSLIRVIFNKDIDELLLSVKL